MANPVGWFEITGKDGKKLQDFYADVFNWKIDANNPMQYGIVDNEGKGIGGGISAGDGGRNQVTFYISVENPQAYLEKIESQGGKTIVPVTEVPGMVKFAQFADPEGNIVGLTDANYMPQQQ
jgi:predicted enzyme related to lactoylglutathione lyase